MWPDITGWLVAKMNANRDHPAIKRYREAQWALVIPFFGLGWTYGFLEDFRELVGRGGPWDFKNTVSFESRHCPTRDCQRTVTLCGLCVDYDVAGNIHYGWVGRAADLRRWFLLWRAAKAQKGGVDPDHDVVAIKIGMDMWDTKNRSLCHHVRKHAASLNYGKNNRAKDCAPCNERL